MNSVIVKLQKGTAILTPTFRQCLVNLSKADVDFLNVQFKLVDDSLLLSSDGNLGGSFYRLQHSVFCPFKELDESTKLLKEGSNIPVAVSIILESLDNHILLTRRASHMRSAPNVWVPPGGHLDRGESLIECGLRELREETGISLKQDEIQFKILCLWENVYPIILGFGDPKTHTLVVYYHVKCSSRHSDLTITMNPDEVGSYAWLNESTIAQLFKSSQDDSLIGKQFVLNNNQVIETDLDYFQMFNRALWSTGKLYSGVQASLLTWLKNFQAKL